MTATAKLFQNGQSQAVRLPKEFRFEGESEVEISRLGDFVLLSPHKANRWSAMFEAVNEFSDDFIITREELPQQNRAELFS
jgi:antitoxin VapB